MDVAWQRFVVIRARVGQPADVIFTQVGVVDVCACKRREGVNARCKAMRLGSLTERHCDCRALVFRQTVGAAIVRLVAPLGIEKQRVSRRGKACTEVGFLAGFVHCGGLREEVKAEYVSNGGHYDIYNGETVTIESKDGRDVIDTEMSKEEFFDIYGKDSKEER